MSARKNRNIEEPSAAADEALADTPNAPEGFGVTPEQAEAPEADQDLTALLKQEVQELRDKNLRVIAEARNQQQRAERERAEALRYAESSFARELLVVLDDLERTQESARTASDVQAVVEGVRIVHEHFLKILKARGIEPIVAQGAPFDPTYHEALLQQPSDDIPAGVVLQEIAPGYKMHERVLRPSRVIVSSGPATPPKSTGGEASE